MVRKVLCENILYIFSELYNNNSLWLDYDQNCINRHAVANEV